jgi:hypothetical protein
VTRRPAAISAAVVVAAGALVLAVPAPAGAAACSGTSGVTVVVDFGSLGGVQVGCAAGDPGSGLTALHAAGFATTGTQKDGPAFVCRINGAPASDPCVLTPPSSAYWSYWHADRGAWAYSSLGAASYDPAPGSVEGWAFGAGARPGIAPPAPTVTVPIPPRPKPTTNPVPRPPAPPPGATTAPRAPAATGPDDTGNPPASDPSDPNPTAATGRGNAPAGRPGTSSGAAPPSAAAVTTSPVASASPTCSPSSSESPSGAVVQTSGPCPPTSVAIEPTSSSQKAVGATALGVALVLGIGIAAFLVAQRRRRAG